MIKSPCQYCPDRVLGCHSTCEKYIAFRAAHDAEVEARRKEQLANQDIYSVRVDGIRKAMRTMRKNGGKHYDD